ncbi:hypothetical protein [Halopolyspora algeriensis]|uniref:hypothetical protein n=1 Tax=Halopolyspora algeriensis TaxID=1500506 RepID=UPI000DF311AA|nr:hypothetical protein [Halopolyspora algeriensis]
MGRLLLGGLRVRRGLPRAGLLPGGGLFCLLRTGRLGRLLLGRLGRLLLDGLLVFLGRLRLPPPVGGALPGGLAVLGQQIEDAGAARAVVAQSAPAASGG